MAGENPIEPIHQFQITEYFPLGDIGGAHFGFTNSALFMILTVGVVGAFLILSTIAARWFPAAGSCLPR